MPGFEGRQTQSGPNRAWRLAAWALALFVVLTVPLWLRSNFLLYLATQAAVYMVVALALNLLMGYAGQISIGHGALVGIGAYATAILMMDAKWSFWLAAPAAMVITSAVGLVMALPSLRLSTWFFALISLSFAAAVQELLAEWQSLTRGYRGIVGIPPPSLFDKKFELGGIYVLVVVTIVVLLWLIRNLIRSRIGRAMIAIRDNPHAATAAGVSLVRLKLFAFTLSAAIAGLGGAFFAVQKTVLTTEDFSPDFSIFFLLIVVVGGTGHLWGPIVGTLVFFLVPELLGPLQSWRILVYGAALLILMLFAPQGIVGSIARARRLRRKPAMPDMSEMATAATPVDGAALKMDDVRKAFGGVRALDGVRVNASPGSVHAIVGPNGSGKTTLLNIVCGYYPASSGVIRLGNTDLMGLAPHAIARLGVGRTFQTPKLLNHETVLDNVLLGAFPREKATALEIMLALPRARDEARASRRDALRFLDFVGIAEKANYRAGEIPHGQQRLVEIARALVGLPKVLLLDEPAAGLSLDELDRLGKLIRDIAQNGATVVIVEHHLELVGDVCRSVTVLERGRILADGTPAEVFNHAEVVAAYIGRNARSDVP
jgi:branched-chain amino acid transport system permease protein